MLKKFGCDTAKGLPPTENHRPAMWNGVLGTVYALSDDGEIRNFNYDREAALEFAGATKDRDPRIGRALSKEQTQHAAAGYRTLNPSTKTLALWITK